MGAMRKLRYGKSEKYRTNMGWVKPLLIEGLRVCMATQPEMPNMRGNSRGRVKHLDKDGNRTLCNLLITEYIAKQDTTNPEVCEDCKIILINNNYHG